MPSNTVFTQSVTTSYVALASHAGEFVSILNGTGADLLIRYASESGAGREITLADAQSVGLSICATSSEIQIKAAGAASGVQVVVK